MDINYFKAIQGGIGCNTMREHLVREAQENISTCMNESINCPNDSTRNGTPQRFLITPSTVNYKYVIEAFPNEDLFVGDIIEFNNEKWIVTETRVGNPLQITGTIYLCNLEFKFQNGTSEIHTRPAVLDSGVYSTTKNGNDEVQYTDKQFKLYLPYDEDTKKIYVDKRIAVDTRYDKDGKEILEVYKVTGTNRVARSWGKGGHLLICELRSDMFSPEHDNIENLICDFIYDTDRPSITPELLECAITGRETISLGQTKTYKSVFYDKDGVEVTGITPVWSTDTVADITTEESENSLKITVADNEDSIGQMIVISLTDSEGLYKTANLEVEVLD